MKNRGATRRRPRGQPAPAAPARPADGARRARRGRRLGTQPTMTPDPVRRRQAPLGAQPGMQQMRRSPASASRRRCSSGGMPMGNNMGGPAMGGPGGLRRATPALMGGPDGGQPPGGPGGPQMGGPPMGGPDGLTRRRAPDEVASPAATAGPDGGQPGGPAAPMGGQPGWQAPMGGQPGSYGGPDEWPARQLRRARWWPTGGYGGPRWVASPAATAGPDGVARRLAGPDGWPAGGVPAQGRPMAPFISHRNRRRAWTPVGPYDPAAHAPGDLRRADVIDRRALWREPSTTFSWDISGRTRKLG